MRHLHSYARLHGVTYQKAEILVEGLVGSGALYATACRATIRGGGGQKADCILDYVSKIFSI